MFKNYLLTAFRSLTRNKQFTLINIGGLAIGIAIALFIMEYVGEEWNANRFNKLYSSIYRINLQDKEGNVSYNMPPGYAPLLKQRFPSIKNYTRIADGIASGIVARADSGDKPGTVFQQDNMMYADAGFFEVFSFPIKNGTGNLSRPQTAAISETMALKLFGSTAVAGKPMSVSNQFGTTLYTINAVYQLPASSDIKAEVVLSLHTLENASNRDDNDWADPKGLDASFATAYVVLDKQPSIIALQQQWSGYLHTLAKNDRNDKVVLQSLANTHLAPHFNYPLETYGNLLLVTVFTGIAILVLLLGWINYINLATAQSLNRSKEIGIRKVLGASRKQLIVQYLSEAFLLTIGAAVLALLLVQLFQKAFNGFTGRAYALSSFVHGGWWIAGAGMIITGSLLSGGYVALAITQFNPIAVISGKVTKISNGFSLRKVLVVFQFTVSIALIVATVVIYRQLQFVQTENLGMQLNKLLVIKGPTVSVAGQGKRNADFKARLAQLPFISKYAASNNVPGIGFNFFADGITNTASSQPADKLKSYAMFIADERFFDTYGIGFKEGQGFSKEDAVGSWRNIKKVVINEKAAAALGFNAQENLVGKKIMWDAPYEIIGLVKDYHHMSFHDPIKPTIYLASPSSAYYTIQANMENLPAKISLLKSLYSDYFPGNEFDYFFADEKYNQQYVNERKIENVFIIAAALAILIACLGLYGLTAFATTQRIKEIGIRKVLGASVGSIVSLLSIDFIRLIAVSWLIASPIAWWAMNKWLQSFAYRANVGISVFVIAGIAAVSIAFITIAYRTIHAALANPVKSLRSE